MRKIKLILLASIGFVSSNGVGQTNDAGVVTGGVGLAVGAGLPTIDFFPNSLISAEIPLGIGTINTYKPIDLNIGIARPLSIGVQYSPTSFNIIAGTSLIKTKARTWGVNFNLYLVNTNRFSIEASLTPNKIFLNPLSLNFIDENLNVRLGGSGFKTRLKLNFLLSKNAGFYLNLGYDIHRIHLKSFNKELKNEDLEADLNKIISNNIALNIRGLNVGAGLILKINTK